MTNDGMTNDQKKAIAKVNAQVAAENVFRILDSMYKNTSALCSIARRYNPEIGDNAKDRDCEAFEARLKELMLTEKYQAALNELSSKGLI